MAVTWQLQQSVCSLPEKETVYKVQLTDDPEQKERSYLCRVDVDFGGSLADGMTIVDPRVRKDNPENVRVAFNADREKFVKMLFDILGKSKGE